MDYIPTIIVVVAAVAAFATVAMTLNTLHRALRQRTWCETPATIVSSAVSSRLAPRSGEGYNSKLGRRFRPSIRFTYEVAGAHHESTTHSLFVNESSTDREPAEVVARYVVGANATAYVDPREPSRAVLDRSIRWSSILLMCVVGAAFATIAIVGARWL